MQHDDEADDERVELSAGGDVVDARLVDADGAEELERERAKAALARAQQREDELELAAALELGAAVVLDHVEQRLECHLDALRRVHDGDEHSVADVLLQVGQQVSGKGARVDQSERRLLVVDGHVDVADHELGRECAEAERGAQRRIVALAALVERVALALQVRAQLGARLVVPDEIGRAAVGVQRLQQLVRTRLGRYLSCHVVFKFQVSIVLSNESFENS